MLGYFKADNPGVLQPLPDGWYDTGDIVNIDADHYVTIKGRLKRFAKIGGEMVSLAAIKAHISRLWPGHLHETLIKQNELPILGAWKLDYGKIRIIVDKIML